MKLGHAYRRVLMPEQREALYTSAEFLQEDMQADLAAIREGSFSAEHSLIAASLPPRYLLRYTPTFMRRFHACLLTVVWKLGQRERIPLSCVAEELAAHLLIEHAMAALEMEGIEVDSSDFVAFEEELFEDTDFEMLYEGKYDGIEESAFADIAGLVNLAFADWFVRFGAPDNHEYPEPHPLSQDESATDDNTDDRETEDEDERE